MDKQTDTIQARNRLPHDDWAPQPITATTQSLSCKDECMIRNLQDEGKSDADIAALFSTSADRLNEVRSNSPLTQGDPRILAPIEN